MQRANHLDVKRGGLLEHILHLHAVFAYDVGVIAACVVDPLALKVHLVGEDVAAQSAKGTKGVGREEHLVGSVVGHHHLGPMHHGSHDELKAMATGDNLVALFHHLHLFRFVGEELLDHLCRLGGAHHRSLGERYQYIHQRGGVVGLHMVHHHIVKHAAIKGFLDVLEKLPTHRTVARVKEHILIVEHHITVVGDPARYGVDVLEEGQPAVAGADIYQVVAYVLNVLHIVLYLLITNYHNARRPELLCHRSQNVKKCELFGISVFYDYICMSETNAPQPSFDRITNRLSHTTHPHP